MACSHRDGLIGVVRYPFAVIYLVLACVVQFDAAIVDCDNVEVIRRPRQSRHVLEGSAGLGEILVVNPYGRGALGPVGLEIARESTLPVDHRKP